MNIQKYTQFHWFKHSYEFHIWKLFDTGIQSSNCLVLWSICMRCIDVDLISNAWINWLAIAKCWANDWQSKATVIFNIHLNKRFSISLPHIRKHQLCTIPNYLNREWNVSDFQFFFNIIAIFSILKYLIFRWKPYSY